MVHPFYPACNDVFHWFWGALANLSEDFYPSQIFSSNFPPLTTIMQARLNFYTFLDETKWLLAFYWSAVLLIIRPCSPSARGSEMTWGRWRRRGLSISGPATIHHHDICKWVQGVAETCRQQGHCVRSWPATSTSVVQDPDFVRCVVILHIFVISGLFFFLFSFFLFFAHLPKGEIRPPSILCRLRSTWLWLSN